MMHGKNGLTLAIDQGGHASRALVIDSHGCVIQRALREIIPDSYGHERVEYDAESLLASVRAAIDEVIDRLGADSDRLQHAGLATQRSTVVCWDRRSGDALSPVISWQDRRDHDWLRRLAPQHDTIRLITGLPLSAHYGANKLRWCLAELPRVRRAQRADRLAWGPLATYLLFHLLRERPLLVDPVNASRTLLWDLAAGDWSPTLLDLFGLPRAPLPAAAPCRHPFGTLEARGRAIPLQVVIGDQAAALHDRGAPPMDTLHVTVGTGAFVQRSTGSRRLASTQLLSGIAFDNGRDRTHTLEGTVNGAGSALDWFAAGHPDCDLADLPALLATEDEPPLFINGVSGLGTPWMRAAAPIAFVADGERQHDGHDEPGLRAVAVVESLCFLLQTNIEAMSVPTLPPLQRIRIGGGLARLDGLCHRLADLSGLAVERSGESETTAAGLAWLLRDTTSAAAPVADSDHFQPRDNPTLQRRYRRWQAAMARALATRQGSEHRGDDTREPASPRVVAHRGDAGRFPENSVPAIESALRAGIRDIEIDIQLSRDGVPVLFHDHDLRRTTGVTGLVTDLDQRALRELRSGGAPIPTLAEVVELLADWPQAHCFVEIKQESIDVFGIDTVVDSIMAASAPRLAQCTPISFNSDALRAASALGAPRIGWVLTRYDEASRAAAHALAPDYLFCNQRKLPRNRLPLWRGPWHWVVYEVTDRDRARRLAARGVEYIETMQIERFVDER